MKLISEQVNSYRQRVYKWLKEVHRIGIKRYKKSLLSCFLAPVSNKKKRFFNALSIILFNAFV